MQKYVVIEKEIGETPLSCMETWRAAAPSDFHNLPLAYAGRLDPMASGKLLVLIGEECKHQERYHKLDKEYEFSVLFGIGSDTGDVLGRLHNQAATDPIHIAEATLTRTASTLIGTITFPYPHFSSKTVSGKPLHTWAVENRLGEIEIPTYTSTIHRLPFTKLETKTRASIYSEVSKKIETIPPVTDKRKARGNDFRRVDVRSDWKNFFDAGKPNDTFFIAHFTCIASSGTYMRTLAEEIGRRSLGVPALAYHIHRTTIGHYYPIYKHLGVWRHRYH